MARFVTGKVSAITSAPLMMTTTIQPGWLGRLSIPFAASVASDTYRARRFGLVYRRDEFSKLVPSFVIDHAELTMSGRNHYRLLGGIAVIVAGYALGLRTLVFVRGRPLEIDEAMLALNVALRGFLGLTRPLAFEQTAPILFLWGTRLVAAVSGFSEHSLRFIPFVAGLCFGPLLWWAGRQMLSGGGAVCAGLLGALSPIDVAYGDFFKPYAVDAVVGALLLALAFRIARAPADRRRWTVFILAAIVSPFLSAPAPFVIAGAAAGLAMSPDVRRAKLPSRAVLTGVALMIAAVAVNYVVFQRRAVDSAYMQHYWEAAFFRPPWHRMAGILRDRAGWTVQELFLGHFVPTPLLFRAVLDALVIAGIAVLARRHGVWAAVLLTAPWFLVFAASALQLYPLADRTLLFAAATVLLATTAAIEALASTIGERSRTSRWAFPLMATLLLLPAAMDAARRTMLSLHTDDFTVAWADFLRRAGPTAPVYVFSRNVPVWTWYSTDWGHPDTVRARLLMEAASRTGPNSGNAPSRGRPVVREGDSLAVVTERLELIGIPTGAEARAAGSAQRETPDPGWATNEAARIHSAATPEIWVFFTHCHNDCDAVLIDTLLATGGRIEYQHISPAARVYEYRRN